MVNKYYCFAGITFAVSSEIEIGDSRYFRQFYSDKSGAACYSVFVRQGELPPKRGAEVYRKEDASLFQTENGTLFYYAYPERPDYRYREYSCLERSNRDLTLTVKDAYGFRDSILFTSLNMPPLLLENGAVMFHCSYVLVDGEAVIFTGKSGVGKSTQASLWEKHRGAAVVNGDRCVLKTENGCAVACGIPLCGSSRISLNKKAPVKAIVLLDKGEENTVGVLQGYARFAAVLNGITYEPRSREESTRAVELASQIASACSVLSFTCRADESAVDELEKYL